MFSTTTSSANREEQGRLAGGTAGRGCGADPGLGRLIEFGAELARRYDLAALSPLLASCRLAAAQQDISVAVTGRFKAGKSSFLNHFTGRAILPVGVIPVTTVVTEIRYGATERAAVQFLDGRVEDVPISGLSEYVSERENPGNGKQVRLIRVDLPGLERFRGLRFVDTPGLESALLHNTEETLKWLPNVGLALAAVSVDPPLSQQDLDLLARLYQFTPNVTVLLTKIDLVSANEREEVIAFVNEQLRRAFGNPPPVVPYSIRPGYEDLRASLERSVLGPVLARFGPQRRAIVRRKIDTLLRECSAYLTLALQSAELAGAERRALKERLVGEGQAIGDVKSQLRLIARHAAAGTRTLIEARLQRHQRPIEERLQEGLAAEFPQWTKSLAFMLESFDGWLASRLREGLAAVSASERLHLAEPLKHISRQVAGVLQGFRDRLSEGTERAFGVPLRTTEVEIEIREPEAPDIHIGKIFDRNWELLSPVIPVALIRAMVRRHFQRQVSYKLSTNLSRLASQWEERINTALLSLEKEAEGRLDELAATVGRLIESGGDGAAAIRKDLEQIDKARSVLGNDA